LPSLSRATKSGFSFSSHETEVGDPIPIKLVLVRKVTGSSERIASLVSPIGLIDSLKRGRSSHAESTRGTYRRWRAAGDSARLAVRPRLGESGCRQGEEDRAEKAPGEADCAGDSKPAQGWIGGEA
jgi:hypothetical protein